MKTPELHYPMYMYIYSYVLTTMFNYFSVTYEGDNFVRFSGDTQKMAQTQSMFIAVV